MKAKTEVQLLALKLEDEATFDIHHEAKACMTNAAAELRRLENDNRKLREALTKQCQVHDDVAYKEAANLATSLFKKHFAYEEHYASGKVVWGLCDTTAGVISQIDNMVGGLVHPQPVQQPVLKVYKGDICYKSEADDQSYGMWCPVAYDYPHGLPDDTNLYTSPQAAQPLTHLQAKALAEKYGNDPLNLIFQTEKAHGITKGTT